MLTYVTFAWCNDLHGELHESCCFRFLVIDFYAQLFWYCSKMAGLPLLLS
jgi:hypothetical protein